MKPADVAQWQAARTLADLGEVTARFLEGEIGETPSHLGPPVAETTPLIPVLAAVNRAGFVTHQSQPGVAPGRGGSAQRANVSGFASDATFSRLMTLVAGAELVITAARGLAEDWQPSVVVTIVDGAPYTRDGGSERAGDLEYYYAEYCHPDAIKALCEAWQVTFIDPVWGRNDQLWPLLQKFAADAGASVVPPPR
jgi:hypothetical protein